MLLSAVSVLVVAQSRSEIPEGLMNNPVCLNNFRNEVVDVVNILLLKLSNCLLRLRRTSSMRSSRPNKSFIFS